MTKRLEALKASTDSLEFFGNSDPKCPHCGSIFDIHTNEAWSLFNDNESHSVDCQSCELEFTVETRCTYTFSTEDQEDDDDDDVLQLADDADNGVAHDR